MSMLTAALFAVNLRKSAGQHQQPIKKSAGQHERQIKIRVGRHEPVDLDLVVINLYKCVRQRKLLYFNFF